MKTSFLINDNNNNGDMLIQGLEDFEDYEINYNSSANLQSSPHSSRNHSSPNLINQQRVVYSSPVPPTESANAFKRNRIRPVQNNDNSGAVSGRKSATKSSFNNSTSVNWSNEQSNNKHPYRNVSANKNSWNGLEAKVR